MNENKQAEPVAWVKTKGGAYTCGDYTVSERVDGKGWNATTTDKQILLAATFLDCISACEADQLDPAPAVAQEPVHFRAVLCREQQDQAIGVVPKVVGFVDKKAAEQFILEKRDFQGWRYNLEPLYTEAPAVAHPPADVVRELVEALREIQVSAEDCAEGKYPWPHHQNYKDFADHAKAALKSAKEHGL